MSKEFIRLSHGQVCYELKGTPRRGTVVLVSGLSIPMFLWDPNFDFLVQNGYQVLRFDLYGRGLSSHPNTVYDYSLFVNQLEEITTELPIKGSFYLFGTSMGAPIAAQFAERNPKRVKKLILSGPVGFKKELPLDGKLLSLPLVGDVIFKGLTRSLLKKHVKGNFYSSRKHPEIFNQILDQVDSEGYCRSMLSTIRHAIPTDMSEIYSRVGKMKIPVMIFCGQHDTQTPLNFLTPHLEKALPKAKLVVFGKSNHLPHYEEPEATNGALLEFFN